MATTINLISNDSTIDVNDPRLNGQDGKVEIALKDASGRDVLRFEITGRFRNRSQVGSFLSKECFRRIKPPLRIAKIERDIQPVRTPWPSQNRSNVGGEVHVVEIGPMRSTTLEVSSKAQGGVALVAFREPVSPYNMFAVVPIKLHASGNGGTVLADWWGAMLNAEYSYSHVPLAAVIDYQKDAEGNDSITYRDFGVPIFRNYKVTCFGETQPEWPTTAVTKVSDLKE